MWAPVLHTLRRTEAYNGPLNERLSLTDRPTVKSSEGLRKEAHCGYK